MNEFFQSKFVQDLKDGKLPPVEVSLTAESLVQLFAGSIITAAVIILMIKISKQL